MGWITENLLPSIYLFYKVVILVIEIETDFAADSTQNLVHVIILSQIDFAAQENEIENKALRK